MISIYKELLDDIKTLYTIAIDKYLLHIESEGQVKSDEMFLEWVRLNINQIFSELYLLYSDDTSVISSLNLVKGSFEDELNWSESNKKSLRSTIVNNLTGLSSRIDYLISISSSN